MQKQAPPARRAPDEQPAAITSGQQFAIREGKRTAGFGTVSQVLD
jgi:translation elongation factor EF-Tu-like GTPase